MRDLGLDLAISLLLLVQGFTASSQKPLLPPEAEISAVSFGKWDNYWRFNYTSSAPHYFASLYGLLQQWPNTFFPNGHSIVPCEIPAFTKLYHGRTDGDPPPSPEWVAFDIDMSYGIMGGRRDSHMLTYQTTKTVKCIYFDGESATLFGTGQLDTQMLHIFGNVSGPPPSPDKNFRGLWQEYARALGLCDWLQEKKLGGLGWGFEGIVRMNAGFEMIWCNFTSPSIRLISHLNVTAPLLPPTEEEEAGEFDASPTSYYPLPPLPTRSDRATDPSNPPAPPNWRADWGREPFFRSQSWNWFSSSTAHYGSTAAGSGHGETRVKITSCGFMSYYSPKFVSESVARAEMEQQSLNLTEDGLWTAGGSNATRLGGLTALTRRRRAHKLDDVSTHDAGNMRADSERVLMDLLYGGMSCSGMDWTLVANEIVQTYSRMLPSFLKSLRKFENVTTGNYTASKEWAIEVRDLSHTFLLPFIEYPDSNRNTSYSRESKLFHATYSRCRFHHTRLLDPEEGIVLGPEESATKWAVEETTGGICSVLVDIGLSIESFWQSMFNAPDNYTSLSTIESEVRRWKEGVAELMAWLGWAGEWTSCKEKCEWDEKCFIPMWPLMARGAFSGGPGRGRNHRRPYSPVYSEPTYGGPPYEPGYRPPPYFYPPGNRTCRPGGGLGPWQPDETDLWEPRCVKPNYFTNV